MIGSKVKPLVWEECANMPWRLISDGLATQYVILDWALRDQIKGPSGKKDCELWGTASFGAVKRLTSKAAKAAAQAEYERRILDALEPDTEADALRAEVKRLREALKFYAPIEIAGVKYVGGDDAGWRATAALAKATQ